MNLLGASNHFYASLSEFLGREEAISCSRIVLEFVTGISRSAFITNSDFEFSNFQIKQLDEIILELKSGRPLQYILKEAWFYEMLFYVDDNVLIPRPETEEMVDCILKSNDEKEKKVLDIGTGSGCIAITLAKHKPNWQVYGIDVSESALNVASQNARQIGVNVKFQLTDVLNPISVSDFFEKFGFFDVIISNPPYISFHEKSALSFSVMNFEPHLALFAHEHDSLVFYKAINRIAKKFLVKGGKMYYEINENKGNEMIEQMKCDAFHGIELIKDISGKNRIITATK